MSLLDLATEIIEHILLYAVEMCLIDGIKRYKHLSSLKLTCHTFNYITSNQHFIDHLHYKSYIRTSHSAKEYIDKLRLTDIYENMYVFEKVLSKIPKDYDLTDYITHVDDRYTRISHQHTVPIILTGGYKFNMYCCMKYFIHHQYVKYIKLICNKPDQILPEYMDCACGYNKCVVIKYFTDLGFEDWNKLLILGVKDHYYDTIRIAIEHGADNITEALEHLPDGCRCDVRTILLANK